MASNGNSVCFTDPDYVVSGHRDFEKCTAESFTTQAEFVSHMYLWIILSKITKHFQKLCHSASG
jgi:hypothetical protein